MIYVLYVLIRTHDGPKEHVFPYVCTPNLVLINIPYVYAPYLVLFINTIVRVLPYPYYGGHMIYSDYALYVLIRTHDGPKKHVSPYVCTPYLVLINIPYVYAPYLVLFINTIVRVLPYPYYGGAYDICTVVIRTHDGPKKHVLPYAYTPN